jgi:hypothetical protein
MTKLKYMLACCALLFAACAVASAQGRTVQVSSVAELARYAAESGNTVRVAPGVYKMSDYFTDEVAAKLRPQFPTGEGRQPVWMLNFSGSRNRFEMTGVVLEIDTTLYKKLPGGRYTRCLFISGSDNRVDGLTIRNTGPNQGSNGNILSLWGDRNMLENVTLYVHGSFPFGYGDLLGKGGPNLVSLQKQSGFMIGGDDNTLRRCKVVSRALGHCFYIQGANNTRLEDCYAEGIMRPTSEMLRETSGPAFDLKFRSVYENRDGRFMITAGYMKSLVEDGYRTYGGGGPKNKKTGKTTLVNCVAINTRAGFEVNGPEEGEEKTVIENGTALGTERAYLLGSNVLVRNSRGDIAYGPLLYLRGGHGSDVDLQLTGRGSDYTVHALATIAGSDHRVRISGSEFERQSPSVPIMLGYGMPESAEMSAPIRPAATKNVTLINELKGVTVIRSAEAADSTVKGEGAVVNDADTRKVK